MTTYGMPYKGSKNAICDWLMSVLPGGDVFVDLFAGGGAVTHAAILSGKYRRYVMNDARPGLTQMFIDAINGKYSDRTEWVPREEFFAKKDTDPFIATVWSFGNNMSDYLYGNHKEDFCRNVHMMLTAKTIRERRMKWREVSKQIYNQRFRVSDVQSLESLERLDITANGGDYQSVIIPADAVVYADIPYRNTRCQYGVEFDHDRFYAWLREQSVVVYVSEYTMPDDFVVIAAKERYVHSSGSGKKPDKAIEKVFVHERFAEQEMERMKGLNIEDEQQNNLFANAEQGNNSAEEAQA